MFCEIATNDMSSDANRDRSRGDRRIVLCSTDPDRHRTRSTVKNYFSLRAVTILCVYPCHVRATGIPVSADRNAEQLYITYLARDYFELETQLSSLDPGEQRREFFEGQLDAAFLYDESADKKLRHFLGLSGMEADWRKEAWQTLGDTQLRRGNYEAAEQDLAHALDEPSAKFTARLGGRGLPGWRLRVRFSPHALLGGKIQSFPLFGRRRKQNGRNGRPVLQSNCFLKHHDDFSKKPK